MGYILCHCDCSNDPVLLANPEHGIASSYVSTTGSAYGGNGCGAGDHTDRNCCTTGYNRLMSSKAPFLQGPTRRG